LGELGDHGALPERLVLAEQIAAEIDRLLSDDPLTSGKLAGAKDANKPSATDEILF